MSIKRLALCRSQGRLFVLLRFAGQDVAALIEREGSQAFAHATSPTNSLTRKPHP